MPETAAQDVVGRIGRHAFIGADFRGEQPRGSAKDADREEGNSYES